jgi:hypothetical protein
MQAGDSVTVFSDLTATLAIAEGNLATDDLSMVGNGYTVGVAGKGSVLNGLIDAKARIVAGETAVPVTITGKWRAPVVARETATAAPEQDGAPPNGPAHPTGG